MTSISLGTSKTGQNLPEEIHMATVSLRPHTASFFACTGQSGLWWLSVCGWRPHSDGLPKLSFLPHVSSLTHIEVCEGQTLGCEWRSLESRANIVAHTALVYGEHSFLGIRVCKHTVVRKW